MCKFDVLIGCGCQTVFLWCSVVEFDLKEQLTTPHIIAFNMTEEKHKTDAGSKSLEVL